jgi:hypothetical protein
MDFQLERIGIVMEPQASNPMEVGGVLWQTPCVNRRAILTLVKVPRRLTNTCLEWTTTEVRARMSSLARTSP